MDSALLRFVLLPSEMMRDIAKSGHGLFLIKFQPIRGAARLQFPPGGPAF